MQNGDKLNSALVIGAGIAGIKAALDLAELGHKVYLCDCNPCVGGTLLQLDKWFPDDHCGMCKVLPTFFRDASSQYCLRRGLIHPNIEILPLSEVTKVDGTAGDFKVTIHSKAPGIKPDLCIGCGKCAEVCPVEVDDPFNQGLQKRKAAYLGNPLGLVKTYIIDRDHCTQCNACVEACPTSAIDLSAADEQQQLSAGALILASGFEEFDPLLASQYGYKRFPNVITSIELERLLSSSGPTQGKLVRPSDSQKPKSVAFLQCVGSRSLDRNYCSSACCMYALKEAIMIKQADPDTDLHIFFMDFRAFGKGYYRYYEKAKNELGIRFTRCRVPRVMQNFKTNNINFNAIGDDGNPVEKQFDLVVLGIGQTPSPRFSDMANMLKLDQNDWGYCRTKQFSTTETPHDGIFVCGSASAPKDIADSLVEASAAAGQASLWLSSDAAAETEAQSEKDTPEIRVAVFICNCGEEISKSIDLKDLVDFSRGLSDVVHAEEVSILCQQETLENIRAHVRQIKASHVIVAGCSTLAAHKLFEDTPVEMINVREGLAWVHQGQVKAATLKARALIAMALSRLRLARPVEHSQAAAITARALVIGGGLAGLSAALSIAGRGHTVDLVEKTDALGGHLQHIYSTLEGSDVQPLLQNLTARVTENPHIRVIKQAVVTGIRGHAGTFDVSLEAAESGSQNLEAGAIVIATGAEEFTTSEYLYGQNEQVLTQRELEEKLFSGQVDPQGLKSIAMIQCVGSRDPEHPWCSRICCTQALKNSLKLIGLNPALKIIVLYREVMSYGFREEHYTAAREKGVVFARYALENKPEVSEEAGKIKVKAPDTVLGGSLELSPDLLVLSTAIAPKDNHELAAIMDCELTEDGFFREAEVKFRPVDMLRDGIFVCGLAHSPRGIDETIAQAQAAAGRASLILSRSRLVSGRSVSEVNETWCSGCELCINACPYKARTKDRDKGVAVVFEALCQACGACVSICPNKASKLRGLTDKQILAALDAAI
jgi:heterodisulfide reductase subunit A